MWKSVFASRASARAEDEKFVLVEKSAAMQDQQIPEVFRLSQCNGLDLYEVTVDELQHHFSSGSLDSVTYTKYCLENIRKVRICSLCVFDVLPASIEH